MSEDIRYPVGVYTKPVKISPADRERFIEEIAAAPGNLRKAVAGLNAARLDTPYREGGWTVRQVVHHLPDSHMNAYIRFKFALTLDDPLIQAYEEALWAELPEAKSGPPEISLALLDAIHNRWVAAIRSLPPGGFARRYRHPASGLTSLDEQLANYAWHGRHHVGHITALRRRMGW